ncbi:MAG: GAF domain-containing protein, partial [Candidatus Limnocylindria bacterium]
MLGGEVAAAREPDLLTSIFAVAVRALRGERASLLVRAPGSADLVLARAAGIPEAAKADIRVREGEGIAGRVAASKRPVLAGSGPAAALSGRGGYRTSAFVSVPVLVGGDTRGVLSVADPIGRESFGQTDLETLELIAEHIGAHLAPGIEDRAGLERRLRAEADRALRGEQLLALLVIGVGGAARSGDGAGPL